MRCSKENPSLVFKVFCQVFGFSPISMVDLAALYEKARNINFDLWVYKIYIQIEYIIQQYLLIIGYLINQKQLFTF